MAQARAGDADELHNCATIEGKVVNPDTPWAWGDLASSLRWDVDTKQLNRVRVRSENHSEKRSASLHRNEL